MVLPINFKGCIFMPAKKGQKFKHYSEELKLQAIQMRLKGVSKRVIMEELNIHDEDRLKVWMRKYKKLGEFGLLDQRGRREEYIDTNRYIEKLKRENKMLKKCLEIWMREVQSISMPQSRKPQENTPSVSSVSCLASQEVDTTHT
ncbi:transposase [Brevibacillus sp. IT-7CA2]